jgi:antitoxin (DNA-binding transcriptional repressor) of toxin-antitoxin stability system
MGIRLSLKNMKANVIKVGTHELETELFRYLSLVRDGATLYVTDEGQVVAELRPARETRREHQILERLAAEGAIHLGDGKLEDFDPVQPLPGVQLASQMIIEDRG